MRREAQGAYRSRSSVHLHESAGELRSGDAERREAGNYYQATIEIARPA
jgi:hypothetical protein